MKKKNHCWVNVLKRRLLNKTLIVKMLRVSLVGENPRPQWHNGTGGPQQLIRRLVFLPCAKSKGGCLSAPLLWSESPVGSWAALSLLLVGGRIGWKRLPLALWQEKSSFQTEFNLRKGSPAVGELFIRAKLPGQNIKCSCWLQKFRLNSLTVSCPVCRKHKTPCLKVVGGAECPATTVLRLWFWHQSPGLGDISARVPIDWCHWGSVILSSAATSPCLLAPVSLIP